MNTERAFPGWRSRSRKLTVTIYLPARLRQAALYRDCSLTGETVMTLRSLLFVPGSRPDRFHKALASGADLVCIDFEDAVLPESKVEARSRVVDWLGEQRELSQLCVRVNPPLGELGTQDVAALAEVEGLAWIMLPKVSAEREVRQVAERLPGVGIIALIESPAGVLRAPAIATADPALRAIMFGGADFCAEMGCDMAWEPLLAARGQLALVAGAAGLKLIDVPFMDVKDAEGLETETRAVLSLGFSAKAAIHPKQVPVINRVFSPTEEQIAWARSVIDAVKDDENAAGVVNGKFVDRPIILRARHVLSQGDGR